MEQFEMIAGTQIMAGDSTVITEAENLIPVKNYQNKNVARTLSPLTTIAESIDAKTFDLQICRNIIRHALHGDSRPCPRCYADICPNQEEYSRISARYDMFQRVTCPSCGKWFTALTGTALSGVKFEAREIIFLTLLLLLNQPITRIAQLLNCHPETVRLWQAKYKLEV